METARHGRERGRDDHHKCAGKREHPVQLGEPQVVADREPYRNGSSSEGVIEAIIGPVPWRDRVGLAAHSSGHVDIEQMDLAVARDRRAVGTYEAGRVVPPSTRELDEASGNQPDAVSPRRSCVAQRITVPLRGSAELRSIRHSRKAKNVQERLRARLPATLPDTRSPARTRFSSRSVRKLCTVRRLLAWLSNATCGTHGTK